jgi:hypothetical protein
MQKELLRKAFEAGWSSKEPQFDGGWKTTITFDQWYAEKMLPQAKVLEKIQEQILIVKEDLLKRFPECPHTIRILWWNDNTTLVECRYGTLEKLHISRFYDGTLEYEEIDIKFDGRMMVDGTGLEYLPRNNF